MEKTYLTVAALSAAIGAGSVYVLQDDKYVPVAQAVEQRAPNEMDALLAHAPKDCQEEMARIPDADKGLACAIGESYLGSDKQPSQVLICNGAVRPRRLQACVEEAAAVKAIEDAKPKKPPVEAKEP
jgi:hypothetical protein